MSRRVYIHIGLEKTGSTAFQSVCQENVDNLRSCRILYPQSCLSSKQHGILARAYKRDIRLSWDEISRVKRELMEEIENFDGSVLLSAEEFSWLDRSEISDLRNFLKDYDVKVLIVLRNQVEYINALYAEHVRWSKSPAGFKDFCLLRSGKMDYESLVNDWNNAFPDCIELIVYNRDTVVNDILSRVGVDLRAAQILNTHESHHPTLPPELVEIQSILANNREGRLFQEELWKCFGRAQDLGIYFKKMWQMPAAFEQQFASFELGNSNIAKRFGIEGLLFGNNLIDCFRDAVREGHCPNPIAAVALFTFLKG